MFLPNQQTFGVELEFIVFYTTSGIVVPMDNIERYGPVVEIPLPPIPTGRSWGDDTSPDTENLCVRQKVADAISSAGFKAEIPGKAKAPVDWYDAWRVIRDGSLNNDERDYGSLKSTGVEITSPIFSDCEAAFNEIQAVVAVINKSFRTAVPPACGFHVHVGRGGVPLKKRVIQRIGSLLWAAEPFLDTIHATGRLENRYCFCLRTMDDSYMNVDEWDHGPQQEGDDEEEVPHADLSWERVDRKRKRPTCWPSLRRIKSSELAIGHYFWDERLEMRVTQIDLIDRLQKILHAKTIKTAVRLISLYAGRGAYNFGNLRPGPAGDINCRKPTIEFRQASGSLDGDWIVLWSKICLALSGPAVVDSSDDEFFQLIYDCINSESSLSKYNVFDLLFDIGVKSEDLFCLEDRLASGRHEREPLLPFHRPDDRPNGILDETIGVVWEDYHWSKERRGRYYDDSEELDDGHDRWDAPGPVPRNGVSKTTNRVRITANGKWSTVIGGIDKGRKMIKLGVGNGVVIQLSGAYLYNLLEKLNIIQYTL
ncbi:hypothetical protein NPX13_g6545 [Xylaria arbuscula]|uniref:Amidoligase enzyme n=1 Tax=Xylaria arbuscula TaxID=114810 RepID=A0A9W8NCC3_9PEZI|nr:hypothetical protein NPX13_g6545 [Xylaria arbuscula]